MPMPTLPPHLTKPEYLALSFGVRRRPPSLAEQRRRYRETQERYFQMMFPDDAEPPLPAELADAVAEVPAFGRPSDEHLALDLEATRQAFNAALSKAEDRGLVVKWADDKKAQRLPGIHVLRTLVYRDR